jgi:hypothetical protein
MSCSLEVIPKVAPITWNALVKALEEMLGSETSRTYFEQAIECYHWPEMTKVNPNEPMTSEVGYVFQDSEKTKVILQASRNDATLPTIDILNDYEDSVGKDTIHLLAECWAKIGYSFIVDFHSGGNYVGAKTALLLSKAIALCSDGYLLIEDSSLFESPGGLFSYNEASRVNLKKSFR